MHWRCFLPYSRYTGRLIVESLYLAAFGARALILFGALPLLERTGSTVPMDRPQRILVFWGGVRGAVTLVLAISL